DEDHGDGERAAVRAGRGAAAAADALPPRRAGPDGHPLGLRHLQLRGVHGPARRGAGQVVHGAGRDGRRPRGDDRGGAGEGRRAGPGAAGLRGVPRPAVRVLHAGDAADGALAAGPQARPRRGRDPRGDLRPALPVHGIREHRPLDQVGRGSGGEVMSFGRMHRKEDARFIRGRGTYVDDVKLPGMLHGAILRSPYAHARIVSIDTSAAEAHPKVRAVITGETLAGLNLAWMPTLSNDVQAVLATDKV